MNQYIRRCAFFYDISFFHENHLVRNFFGESDFMGHNNHGGMFFFGNFLDDRQHFAYQFRIQRAGRFVEENHFGVHGHRTSNTDTLLLPAGQLHRIVIRKVSHAYFFEKSHGFFFGFFFVDFFDRDHAFHDVFQGGHIGKQIVGLKYHGCLSANRQNFFLIGRIQIDRHPVVK